MKTQSVVLASLMALGLAGCGGHSGPTYHDTAWYEQHTKTLKKVMAYCGPRADKFLAHKHRYAYQVKNCDSAATAQFNISFWGNPYQKQKPIKVTSGGTYNAVSKALGGG